MYDKNFKKCVLKVFNLVKKIKFLKICKKIFFFVLKCKQKEDVREAPYNPSNPYSLKYVTI